MFPRLQIWCVVWSVVWFGLSLLPTRAVVSEDTLPEQTHWITADTTERPGSATFERPFSLETGLVKAVLLAAADQQATLSLNGVPVGTVQGFQKAVTLDVTRWVRPGTNFLVVSVTNSTGPAACRVLLELALADGRQRWVVTDASWQVRPAAPAAAAPAVARGPAGQARWGNPFAATKSADAYNSWMLAQGAQFATDPATFSVQPGFQVDRLRSAQPDEDSWIALAFDPQGRLTVAKEKKGLLRFTLSAKQVEQVEVIEDTLQECRGLLYAHDSLYVNANNSRGFFRLRDLDGDGRYEDKKLLLATEGGVGHGRNQLRLGPDGLIYLVHGDDVVLPKTLGADSPVQQMANDQLVPSLDPKAPLRVSRFMQVGHVLQTDKDGSFFKLYAGGLRNPMDIAFNSEGEMFTYEADMERDIGAPWYRPTRVLHVVPGGDYGWRRGPGNLPPYSPDIWPAALDIGVGSPTGIAFGEGTQFPEPYRRALFLGDWSYGRILAVQLQPQGATYAATSTEFLAGRPLNITDLTFGPDGALYFVTGGRGTKSGLYRVSWKGDVAKSAELTSDPAAESARQLRHRLEQLVPPTSERVDEVWAQLAHSDRWIRQAARLALERLPVETWGKRAIQETNSAVAFNALVALVRLAAPPAQPFIQNRVQQPDWAQLSPTDQLAGLRVLSISLTRFGAPTNPLVAPLQNRLLSLYPTTNPIVNRELCRVLVHLRAPGILEKSLPLLSQATDPEERLHYLMTLWSLREDWNLERWKTYFTALRQAEQEQGARDYFATLKFLRNSLTNQMGSGERLALGDLFTSPGRPTTLIAPVNSSGTVWKLSDFNFQSDTPASPAKGHEVFVAAGCAQCHRAGQEGGLIGPDLTAVSSRFGRQNLLDHILNPTKAVDEKYRLAVVTLTDGTEMSGTVEREGDVLLIQPVEPDLDPVEIPSARIRSRQWSEVSPMPAGLLDAFRQEQVYDLLAFLESLRPQP